MTNPALSISLPPVTWPSQSFAFAPIYLSPSLPIPLPLHLFYSPWSCSQSLQPPLHSLHHPMAKHSDLDSQPPLMWAMWPLRSRCPYTASLILSESRHGPQRGPVINPVQPGPLLHCLNTWCITIPTPMHPHPDSPKHACVGEDWWCNRLFKHLKNRSAFQRGELEPLATASVIMVSGWKSGDMSGGKQMNV